MLYAICKALHLLAIVAWVGGMFFALVCLRPAAAVLEPPLRLALMRAALARFFTVVAWSAGLVFLSGVAMIGLAWRASAASGLAFNMPLDWYAMAGLFFVMLAVFLHVRLVLLPRLERAIAAQAWPQGAVALGAIRWEVTLNLVVGVFIVFLVRLGV